MKLILFNSFKDNKLTCNCKLFCCCRRSVETPCPTLRPNIYENNYKHEYILPFIEKFKANEDVFEICCTVKDKILNNNHHTIRPDLFKSHILYTVQRTHQHIMDDIEKTITRFLKKHKITPKVLLITEYSENLRIHWHGCISKPFSYETAQLLMNILGKIGICRIRRINSLKYFEYIEKDTKKNYQTVKNCFTIN